MHNGKNEQPVQDQEISEAQTIERKTRFFNRVKNRFLAMALAGFVTLGGGWEKSFADQLRIKVPEKAGAVPELVLESGITDEKLEDFKQKIIEGEPEFVEWFNNYRDHLVGEIDSFTSSVLNPDSDDSAKEQELLKSAPNEGRDIIKNDHKVADYLRNNQKQFLAYQQFLKDNIDNILWGAVFLDNSTITRTKMTKSLNPPKIIFQNHNTFGIDATAFCCPIEGSLTRSLSKNLKENKEAKMPEKWDPEITITPKAFLGRADTIDLDFYIQIIIHEIIHTIHASQRYLLAGADGYNFYSTLMEGLTENITFEVLQHAIKNSKTPRIWIMQTSYDDRLVSGGLLNGIFEDGGDNMLSQWHSGIIDDDTLLKKLGTNFTELGLKHADLISRFREFNDDPDADSTELLVDILQTHKLNDIKLSKDFLADIIIRNRSMDVRSLVDIHESGEEWFNLAFPKEESLIGKRDK